MFNTGQTLTPSSSQPSTQIQNLPQLYNCTLEMSNDSSTFWLVGEDIKPSPVPDTSVWNSTLWNTIEEEIDKLDPILRKLSLDIHGRLFDLSNVCLAMWLTLSQANPELSFKETYVYRQETEPRKLLIICFYTQATHMTF